MDEGGYGAETLFKKPYVYIWDDGSLWFLLGMGIRTFMAAGIIFL